MINPHSAFPEVPSKVQSSANMGRPVASLALYTAFILSGCERRGLLGEASNEYLAKGIEDSCRELNIQPERLMAWSDSLLIPPSANFTPEEMRQYLPSKIGKYTLRPYQFSRAAWGAFRLGTIFALGCGLGKTLTSIAAAIGAASAGRCSFERLHIYCPANAIGVWSRHLDFLKNWFNEVHIISHDMAHKAVSTPVTPGGALIIDEVHKLKNEVSRRSDAMLRIRAAFQWCVCLTGTLLHAGPAGMLAVQDIALPGGGRFFNEWSFGEAFDCIMKVKIGSKTKRKVVMPPEHMQAAFVEYMSRMVTSLSIDSPEVAACVQWPGRTHIVLDTFEEPDWVGELRKRLLSLNSSNAVYWIPDCFTRKLEVPMVAAYIQALSAELDLRDKNGLPTLADGMRTQAALAREGRLDRVVIKEMVTAETHTCKFVYAPGTSKDTPGFGPKFKALDDWFTEHPDEKLVLSAVGKTTIDLCIRYLQERGYPFRVIRGGTPSKDRTTFVEEFQEDDNNVLVMVVQQEAGSEAISLTKACFSILMDHSWKPWCYTQFIHRTYRDGQTRDVEHIDMTFGRFQEYVLKRIARGEAFDADVRREIEAQWLTGRGTENDNEE